MHEKKRLVRPVILTPTRYSGFARQPVRDDSESALISGLPAPSSDYALGRSGRYVDMRKGDRR